MANEATPRINAEYLEQFLHRTVRIVGKVVSLHGETATIDAKGNITITLNRESHLQVGHACEVIGKIDGDLRVMTFQATDWGADLDYNAANAVVEATHKYKHLFYEAKGEDDDSLFV